MKLLRFGSPGREKPGLVDAQGRIRDLSKIVHDIAGDVLSPKGLAKLRELKPDKLPLVRGIRRLGPCVGKVGNFIAIGLNYSDHAAEAEMPIPKEPIVFNKAPSCICGPNDDTMIPKGSTKLDYEIELGIIIGSRARYLAKNEAMDVVAGYCLANDVSERLFQIERAGQWTKGKGCETFGPLGPWLVTKDEIEESAKPRYVARRQWRETPARQHLDHDLRLPTHRLGLLAIFRIGARRCHYHRHATGRRARHQARTKIPQGRRRSHARHRRLGRATAEDREV